MPRLENGVGYVNQDTSKEAAKRVGSVVSKRALILRAIEISEDRGRTCYQLELCCGMSHQTTSARIRELARAGAIVDSGKRRETGTGRKAIVWTVKNEKQDTSEK